MDLTSLKIEAIEVFLSSEIPAPKEGKNEEPKRRTAEDEFEIRRRLFFEGSVSRKPA